MVRPRPQRPAPAGRGFTAGQMRDRLPCEKHEFARVAESFAGHQQLDRQFGNGFLLGDARFRGSLIGRQARHEEDPGNRPVFAVDRSNGCRDGRRVASRSEACGAGFAERVGNGFIRLQGDS